MTERYVGRKFKTKFIPEGNLNKKIIAEIIRYCRLLDRKGLTRDKTGNVSVRVSNSILITAGGMDLGNLGEFDIVNVRNYNKENNTVIVAGDKEPSSETIMHWLIYQNYPKVNAVVHVHDPLILDKIEIAEVMGLGITEHEEPYGTLELAEQVLNVLKKSNYVVLRNHGSVAVGKNLKEAVNLILMIHDESKNQ